MPFNSVARTVGSRSSMQADSNTETVQAIVKNVYKDSQGNVTAADVRVPNAGTDLMQVLNATGVKLSQGSSVQVTYLNGSKYNRVISGATDSGTAALSTATTNANSPANSDNPALPPSVSLNAPFLLQSSSNSVSGFVESPGANVYFTDVDPTTNPSGGLGVDGTRTIAAKPLVLFALPDGHSFPDATCVDLINSYGQTQGMYRWSASFGAWQRRDLGEGGGGGGGTGTISVVEVLPAPSPSNQGNMYLLQRNGVSNDVLYVSIQRASGYFLAELQYSGFYVPFTPTGISGLQLWVAADSLSGTLTNGSPIPVWPDMSGNSINLANATTAQQPTFVTSVQNGLPVVRFAQAAPAYLQGGASPLTANQNFSIFVVLNNTTPTDTTNLSALWVGGTTVAPGAGFILYEQNTVYEWVYNPLGSGATTIGTASPIVMGLTTSVYNNASGLSVWRNGSSIFSSGANSYGISVGSIIIGNNGQFGDANCFTDYCEILVYNRALTDGERTSVENYLSVKWNLGF